MSLRPPSAILFDWDNTLVDTWAIIHRSWNATQRALGVPLWSLPETQARVRKSARDSFPQEFGARAEEAMKIFYRIFEAEHLVGLRELPGAGAMLGQLSAAGLMMAVVSNKQGRLLRREAGHLGWSGHFHRLVGAHDAEQDKPAAHAVKLALDGSGVGPGPSVWFVGDTDIDMLCAVRSGCMPILLRPQPPQADEFAEAEPAHYVGSCDALAALVQRSGLADRRPGGFTQ